MKKIKSAIPCHVILCCLVSSGCARPVPPAQQQKAAPSSPDTAPAIPDAGVLPDTAPAPDAPAPGCWKKTFGKPMDPSAMTPSVAGPVPGCGDCETLRAGPKAAGLHPQVLRRLRRIARGLPRPPVEEPLMWVNSGKRDGPAAKSMHNQGLAVDLVICGLDTRQTAARLRQAGFTCVIEYYDGAGNPCNMAHGDLRGTRWARGAYAPGGRKARTCPARAVSKNEDCSNRRKEQWKY